MARGWRGDPPADDDEARERIVDAAMRCLDRYGPEKTGLTDVAKELGITRQTLYRLFPSTDDLFHTVSEAASDAYLDRLAAHVAHLHEPGAAMTEAIAHTYELLPHERHLGLLLATGRSETFLHDVTSPAAQAFGRSMLSRMAVDWAAAGYDERRLDELVDYGLRVLQSLLANPPLATSGAELRRLLERWVAPAIRALATDSPEINT